MRTCFVCGAEFSSDEYNFCDDCGHNLLQEDEPGTLWAVVCNVYGSLSDSPNVTYSLFTSAVSTPLACREMIQERMNHEMSMAQYALVSYMPTDLAGDTLSVRTFRFLRAAMDDGLPVVLGNDGSNVLKLSR